MAAAESSHVEKGLFFLPPLAHIHTQTFFFFLSHFKITKPQYRGFTVFSDSYLYFNFKSVGDIAGKLRQNCNAIRDDEMSLKTRFYSA